MALDRSGGVDDSAEAWGGQQHGGVQRGAAPAGHQHLGPGQGGTGGRGGEVVEDQVGIEVDQVGEAPT